MQSTYAVAADRNKGLTGSGEGSESRSSLVYSNFFCFKSVLSKKHSVIVDTGERAGGKGGAFRLLT